MGNPYSGPEYGGQQPWGQPAPPPAQDPWGQQPGAWDQPTQPQPTQPQPTQPQPTQPQPTQPQPGGWDQPVQQTQPMPVQQPGWPGAEPGGWGQPPQSPPYGSPDPYGWQGGGGAQPPRSSTGLVVGIIGAVVVLLLILVIGGWYLLQEEENPPVANPNPDASASASPSASPSPSGKQPSDLDDEDTDTTPLDPDHMFPSSTFTGDGGSYTLAAVLETDACTGVGSSKIIDLMRRYDCGDMVLGVHLDEDEKLFSSLLVIPLATAGDADDAEDELQADRQNYIDALTYYCPADGKPGADQCKRKADNPAAWYASFQAFHRYLLVSITLYTDGHRTDKLDRVNEMSNDIIVHVKEAILSD